MLKMVYCASPLTLLILLTACLNVCMNTRIYKHICLSTLTMNLLSGTTLWNEVHCMRSLISSTTAKLTKDSHVLQVASIQFSKS